jgi:hypothetical protein
VLGQYERDRFTRPAAVDARTLLALSLAAADALPDGFELLDLAPLAPLGAHSVIAGIAQNRVVSTVRSSEVLADPTNALALEAALRRRSRLATDPLDAVRLAAISRVTRAQRFDGPRSFAHFTLIGLVSAGRDRGQRAFERQTVTEHIGALVEVCRACGFPRTVVHLTDLTGGHHEIVEAITGAIPDDLTAVTNWPEREAGRGYYRSLCFKVSVVVDDEVVEVGDGGLVDWGETLVASRKERMMTSGLSLERLAQFVSRSTQPDD